MSDIPKNVLKGFRYLEKEYPMFDCYYGMTDKFKQQTTITVLPDDNSDKNCAAYLFRDRKPRRNVPQRGYNRRCDKPP